MQLRHVNRDVAYVRHSDSGSEKYCEHRETNRGTREAVPKTRHAGGDFRVRARVLLARLSLNEKRDYCSLGMVIQWLARWTFDLEVGGSSLVPAVVLFP